jgi:3-phosphoshikimate 1-carboxyvinyltransferase
MQVSIEKSDIKGKIKAPSSKSYTIRALMCAALAAGESDIISPLISDDTEATGNSLEKIGVRIFRRPGSWQVTGGRITKPKSSLDCGESAATLRFMTAITAAIPGESRLTAQPSLLARPIEPLLDALNQLGVECKREPDGAGIVVHGGTIKTPVTSLPGNVSSQFISALLILAPIVKGGLNIRLTTPIESRSYVEMTIECLEKFGIKVIVLPSFNSFFVSQQRFRQTQYTVEGDWSSVSYLLAAGALGGDIEIGNLSGTSLQGDKLLLTFLNEMGVPVILTNNAFRIKRSDSKLRPLVIDLNECIDLLPTMAVLASFADGKSEFRGIGRARLKESDRVSSIAQELAKAGVKVIEGEDTMTVIGSKPKGAIFNSHGDHRIAMAMSLVGIVCGNTTIEGAECVSKTYPEFWKTLIGLGGKVDISGK